MPSLLTAALVESAIIIWRDLSQTKILPPPSDFVAVAIIFGLLGLIPGEGAKVAGYFGWGLVLATFLNLWSPQAPTTLALPGNKQATSPGGGTPTTVTTGAVAQ